MFGGPWTQQKLEVLSKYLSAYTKIFTKNPKAQFYTTSYVDAFAGTGVIRRPALGGFANFFPELAKAEEEFRKGSVRRALEVEPPFDKYVFIEKSAKKCRELKAVAEEFPQKKVDVINEDANSALLRWCSKLNTERERAVVVPRSVRRICGMESRLSVGQNPRCGFVDTVPLFGGEPDANAESQATRSTGRAIDEGFWYSCLGEIVLFEQDVPITIA
jgi:hypothetical protein